MSTYNATFQIGPNATNGNPDATFMWNASLNSDNQINISCNYGGGAHTNNNATTGWIDWPSNGGTVSNNPLTVTTGNNPEIYVTGTIAIDFDSTAGSEYVVTLNGAMVLAQNAWLGNCAQETITGGNLVVATQLTD